MQPNIEKMERSTRIVIAAIVFWASGMYIPFPWTLTGIGLSAYLIVTALIAHDPAKILFGKKKASAAKAKPKKKKRKRKR